MCVGNESKAKGAELSGLGHAQKESLVAALREATGLPRETLREMGERGHELVEEKYLWPAIGRQMAEEYEKICR